MKKLMFTLAVISMISTGCLKTRSQVQEDSGVDTKPGNQFKDVQPQGQYVIDELKAEITRMTGRIEDLERAQKSGNPNVASTDDLKKVTDRINDLERAQAAMIEQLKKIQDSTPPPDSAETFNTGRAQFEAKNYEGAIGTLTTYLKTPNGQHAEEATFLRAEALFLSKQYKKAIVDYSKFPEKYTRSKHMPQALLKIALSFEALGMKEDAKAFYQELVEKFPKSPEAKKFRKKLK